MTCIVLALAIFGFAPTYSDGIIIALGATALGGFSAVQEFLAGRQYYRQYFLTSGVRFGLAAALVFLALMYLRDPMAVMLALIFALAVPAVIMFVIHEAGTTRQTRGHMGRIEASQMASVLRLSLIHI